MRLPVLIDIKYYPNELSSTVDTCKNCSKCGKGFKIGINEAYNIKLKSRVGGILKTFCFCSYINMDASDKGISLKRNILEKVFTQLQELRVPDERAYKTNPK